MGFSLRRVRANDFYRRGLGAKGTNKRIVLAPAIIKDSNTITRRQAQHAAQMLELLTGNETLVASDIRLGHEKTNHPPVTFAAKAA
jgi:hypothetical protein